MTPSVLLLVMATVATALIAGLFYSYSCSVMPGLKRTDDPVFVDAMTSINTAIRNPVFAFAYFGAGLFTAVGVLVDVLGEGRYTAAGGVALVLHGLALVVTTRRNLPLNEALERQAREPGARAAFEAAWVRWNNVRAVLCGGAVAALAVALTQSAG